MKNIIFLLVILISFWACESPSNKKLASFQSAVSYADKIPEMDLRALKWRFIGPIAGNRGSVVLGHPTQSNVFYFGASNGLWKTEDAGTYWMPIGDEYFKSGNIGAMEISESDPSIMYVGMGEPQMRNNVSWGDGVYKTIDGGTTWQHLGLEDTHHISQVRIHPTNPEIVYVGAFGHAFGPNPERGVYRTKDGGKNWEQVLFKSENTGVIDLIMNPSNPDELFAAMYEFERKAWGPKTGGPESGLWKTTNGGDTWEDISKANGLPGDTYGRIGVTISASDANRVFALVDSEGKPGLYRSDDGGENWEFVSDFFQIIGRPFYYSHIYANPHNADELWVPNNRMFVSKDAGKTWILEPGIKDDFHDIWIDNINPDRMIATNDGGAQISMTGGVTWSSQHTQKNVQFYRVNVDNDFPYNVYGVGQDVLAYKVPSASRWGGISRYETTIIGNGETSNAIPHPNDPNIIYSIAGGAPFGSGAPFAKNNLATGQSEIRNLWPEPMFGLNASDLEYRFNWDTPFFVSPHDPRTIYAAGNVVFKSLDEGMSWEVISEDLTNDIKERQKITGTPWLSEYFGQEIYSTIHRMDESPLKRGLIWTGSDDGKIFITQNGGASWEDVSIADAPIYSQIYEIEPSPHNPAVAYVAISNYNTDDDYRPYLYKTDDYGKSWTSLVQTFPIGEITRTIREDKVNQGLLYVGTETGLYYSSDDGQNWRNLNVNLPSVPVVDLKVKDNDLVIATNGRGFWIMDDITPLRLENEAKDKATHLYPISDHIRFGYNWWLDYLPGGNPKAKKNYFVQNMRPGLTYYEQSFTHLNGERQRKFIDAGDPRPLGVIIYFKLSSVPDEMKLEILDKSGTVIRSFGKEAMQLNTTAGSGINDGLNMFVWDMRMTPSKSIPDRPATGIRPIVPPGEYQARLTVNGESQEQGFVIQINPKENYSPSQTQAKYKFWMEIYNQVETSADDVIAALKIKEELAARISNAKEDGTDQATIDAAEKQVIIINKLIDAYEGTFVSTGRTLAEIVNLPATIFSKMAFLSTIMEQSEGPAPASMRQVFEKQLRATEEANVIFQRSVNIEIAKLNEILDQ